MIEHSNFDIYTPDTLPLDQDVYLRDEAFAKDYEASFLALWDGKDWEPSGYVSFVAVKHVSPVSLELSWFPNIFDRFHEVTVVLPRDEIVYCVGSWQFDEKPSIFVKSD